jgi:cell division protein FtsN
MAHDYKHVSRARSAKPASPKGAILPFLAGLSIGLLAAFAVFLYHYQSLLQGEVPQITVHNRAPAAGEETPASPIPTPTATTEPPPPTFDFYQILPNQEVSMSEWEADAPAEGSVAAPAADDLLILQVGSFKTSEAADQIKAELALLGIEADVQRVVINGQDAVHRVRIGPFKDKQAFADTRQRLISNDLDFVVLNLKANEAEKTRQ